MHGLGTNRQSERERAIFLQMAQTWLFAAARLDAGFPCPSETVPAGQAAIHGAAGLGSRNESPGAGKS